MFTSTRRTPGLLLTLVLVCVCLAGLTSYACNIPVFRYALERWRPDICEFVLFHHGPLDEANRQQLSELQARMAQTQTNASLKLVDLAPASAVANQPAAAEAAKSRETYISQWEQLSAATSSLDLPYLVVRLPHTRGPLTAWHGPLSQALEVALVDSPARRELSRRLLSGDAIVWLLVRSPAAARNEPVRQLMLEQCQSLSTKIQLPEGIGLPGSELYSEVPLFLKFSLLEIDRDDPREQFLLRVFKSFQPAAFDEGEPLLVPVFGRGRALEVIPADDCNPSLIGDLTAFLCGACSCQVKEQNPGFDLLLAANWDRDLFGEDAPLPPPAKAVGEGDRQPVLLTIPPGQKNP
jgi:hypothetical protein